MAAANLIFKRPHYACIHFSCLGAKAASTARHPDLYKRQAETPNRERNEACSARHPGHKNQPASTQMVRVHIFGRRFQRAGARVRQAHRQNIYGVVGPPGRAFPVLCSARITPPSAPHGNTSAPVKLLPFASLTESDGGPLIGQLIARSGSFQAMHRSCSGA